MLHGFACCQTNNRQKREKEGRKKRHWAAEEKEKASKKEKKKNIFLLHLLFSFSFCYLALHASVHYSASSSSITTNFHTPVMCAWTHCVSGLPTLPFSQPPARLFHTPGQHCTITLWHACPICGLQRPAAASVTCVTCLCVWRA